MLLLLHMNFIAWLIPFIVLISLDAFGDIFAKEFSLKNILFLGIISVVCYMLSNVFWLWSMKTGIGLARGSILYSVVSGILGSFIGIALYHEPLSKYQMIAIFFGVLSIVFFSVQEG